MFHFFEKNREFVRCEFDEVDGRWQITISEPNGHSRTERFASPDQAHARWQDLQARFTQDGWFGPYGRE